MPTAAGKARRLSSRTCSAPSACTCLPSLRSWRRSGASKPSGLGKLGRRLDEIRDWWKGKRYAPLIALSYSKPIDPKANVHLRLYFLQAPRFEMMDPLPTETDIKKLGDLKLIEEASEETLSRYQVCVGVEADWLVCNPPPHPLTLAPSP